MAEMNRDRDQQKQGSNRQSNQGMGSNQDMKRGRGQQQSSSRWDGNERRTGAERRSESDTMQMNEGSSR